MNTGKYKPTKEWFEKNKSECHRQFSGSAGVTLYADYISENIKIESGDVIGDFGCGDGEITKALARRFQDSHFIGIDFCDYGWETTYHNIEFIIGNYSEINIDKKIDVALFFSSFHYIHPADRICIIRNVYNFLQDNGIIMIISVPQSDCCAAKLKRVNEIEIITNHGEDGGYGHCPFHFQHELKTEGFHSTLYPFKYKKGRYNVKIWS